MLLAYFKCVIRSEHMGADARINLCRFKNHYVIIYLAVLPGEKNEGEIVSFDYIGGFYFK